MSSGSERDKTHIEPPVADERRVAAWIGKALFMKGDVVCSENLMIDGTFEGTIEVGNHSLTIGPEALIKADLVAKTITIEGTVIGNVTARDKLDLRATGWVEGNVRAPRVVVADGALIRGRVETATKAPSTAT